MGYAYQKEDTVTKYLPLVKQIADKMDLKDGHEMDKEDLVSIGVIGLMDAIEKFDESKKVPFEAYARLRIKGTIIDELRKFGRVSRDKMSKLNKLYDVKRKLQQRLNRDPKDEEIIKEMDISQRDLHKIYETMHNLSNISLEETIFGGDSSDFNLLDIIDDKDSKNPEEALLVEERKEKLINAIDSLSKRDKIVLNLYYQEELTLREIGDVLEVSVSRVSQIHGKVLMKLRDLLTNEKDV
ncbi:MAG: FliA/WhiG family RNA polymerase sigma factor [Firmicutes bacterium]|nr:FliA/WhiG family RNA polymerase sigma factor [Bacillota bacterium]